MDALARPAAPIVNTSNAQAEDEKIPLWLLVLTEPVFWLFRALHTVKCGLVLLALLTAVCIAGSIVSADADMGPDKAKAYIFNTWWFLGLMGLLAVNLVLATWDRSIAALTLYKKASFRDHPAFYEKIEQAAAVPAGALSADDLEAQLRKEYTIVRRKGDSFYAQRGLLSRTGFTIIHLGLLATLASGFYRILADEFRVGVFDATVILPEGLTTENYFTRKDRLQKPTASNLDMHDMPFQLRLLNFHVENHPGSTVAKKYSSLIELKDPDNGHTSIHEVTMEVPLIYKGYKVTQNSYSPTDKVKRGRFIVTDRSSGTTFDIDATNHDPVLLDPVRNSNGLFFQVDTLAPGATYNIVDLANRQVVERGTVESPQAAGPLPMDFSNHAAALAQSKYAYLVAAMFPHFAIDSTGQPTTLSEEFVNPAVLVMVFKNGKPNGYLWLFQHEEAARIMGQPHPEVSARFEGWRVMDGRDGKQGLVDYEVNLSFVDKSTSRPIGAAWVQPGKINELGGIDPQILARPNITAEEASLRRRGSGGAANSVVAAGGIPSAAGTVGGTSGRDGRFSVVFAGTQDGYVSYLGFMKDPSVFWIYLGCMVIVGGAMIAWTITYREAWFHLNRTTGVLYAATVVRGQGLRARRKFDRLVDRLAADKVVTSN